MDDCDREFLLHDADLEHPRRSIRTDPHLEVVVELIKPDGIEVGVKDVFIFNTMPSRTEGDDRLDHHPTSYLSEESCAS